MANINDLPTEEVEPIAKKVLKIVARKPTVAPIRQSAPVKAVLPVAKPIEDEKPTASGDVTIDRDALTQLKVDSLKDIIRSANVKKANVKLSGTKAELVERILDSSIAKEEARILYSTFSKTNSKRTTTKEKPVEAPKPKKSPLKIRKVPSVRESRNIVEPKVIRDQDEAEIETNQDAHELLDTLLELKPLNEIITLLRAEISLIKGKKPLQVVDKVPSPVKVAVVAKPPITNLIVPKVLPKLAPLSSTAGSSRNVAVIKPIINKPVVVEKQPPVVETESDDLPKVDFDTLKSPQVDRNGANEYFNRRGAKQDDSEYDEDGETDDEENTEETPEEDYDEADNDIGDMEPIGDDDDDADITDQF